MRSAFYSSKTGTSRRRLKGLGQFDDEYLMSADPSSWLEADYGTDSGGLPLTFSSGGTTAVATTDQSGAVAPATPDQPTWWQSILSAVPNIAQTYYGLEYTKEIRDINLQRVSQGLPPLSTTQMQQLSPQVNVGVAPGTQNTIVYIALGLGAVLLLMPLLSGGRKR